MRHVSSWKEDGIEEWTPPASARLVCQAVEDCASPSAVAYGAIVNRLPCKDTVSDDRHDALKIMFVQSTVKQCPLHRAAQPKAERHN